MRVRQMEKSMVVSWLLLQAEHQTGRKSMWEQQTARRMEMAGLLLLLVVLLMESDLRMQTKLMMEHWMWVQQCSVHRMQSQE